MDDILAAAAADAEQHLDQTALPPDSLAALDALVLRLHEHKDRLEVMENEVAQIKREIAKMEYEDVPNAMEKLGLVSPDGKGKFDVSDGSKVHLRTQTFVTVLRDHMDTAILWLKTKGYGRAVREDISATELGKIRAEEAAKGNIIDNIVDPNNPDRKIFNVYTRRSAVCTGRVKRHGE